MPRTVSPQRLFRDALGGARLPASRTITNAEAERALRAIQSGVAPDAQRAIVSAFLGSRASGQLSARAQETLRAFIARGGVPARTDSALDVRTEAARETRDARSRTQRAQARLDALLSGTDTRSAAQLRGAFAALAAARGDVRDARALLLKLGRARGVRAAASALTLAQTDLDDASALLGNLRGRARGARVKRSEVQAVKRWLLAPELNLAEAEAQLAQAPRPRGDSTGSYATAKAPSDSEDQGATPPPPHGGTGNTGTTSGTTARSAIERMRRHFAALSTASDEDDP